MIQKVYILYKTEAEGRKIKRESKHQRVNCKKKIEERRTERRFRRNKEAK
jgi:hypothetical protein